MADTEKFTVKDFFQRFPDDDACLEHVMEVRYGLRHTCQTCGVDATFHKMTNRKAYACAQCGAHVYPCAGTIFEASRTSLQSWFYVIFLFVVTRHGVSGKEIQRTLGVTYKTAWRMGQQVRQLMEKADGFEMLRFHVEVDEALVGGYVKGGHGGKGKTIVLGAKQRDGRLIAATIPDVRMNTLRRAVHDVVEKGSIVSTDERRGYNLLKGDGYYHGHVNHSAKEYARYDKTISASHHTNNLESFWRLFKKSIASTHIHVSPKYMDRYLSEFTFRANHREQKNAMFDLLIGAV